MYTLSAYIAGEIDLFENLDIVHITLLVVGGYSRNAFEVRCGVPLKALRGGIRKSIDNILVNF